MAASPPAERPFDAVLEAEFLILRAKILEIAAGLDRLDRTAGRGGSDDPRYAQLVEAARILLSEKAGRAEKVQLLFSRPYDDGWRQEFGV